MNDLETKLKDLFEADAARAPLVGSAPPSLHRRVRRRQARTTVLGAIVAATVAVASIAGVTALDDDEGRKVVAPERDRTRTATVAGVTVTLPTSWHLIDRALAPRGSDDRNPTYADVFELANFDPGLERSVCGGDLPPDGAALWLALGLPDAVASPKDLPVWPVDLTEGTWEPCGPGFGSMFLGSRGGLPVTLWVGFGDEVDQHERDAMFSTVASLGFPSDVEGTVYAEDPAYVLAAGMDRDGPWLLETRPTDRNLEVELARDGGRSGVGDFTVATGGASPIEGWTFGAVRADVARMEFEPDDGGPTIEGRIVVPPPSFGVEFNLFHVDRPSEFPRSGTWWVFAADGTVLGQHARTEEIVVPPPEQPAPAVPGTFGSNDWYAWRTELLPTSEGLQLSVFVGRPSERRSEFDLVWRGSVPVSPQRQDGSLNAIVLRMDDRAPGDSALVIALVPPSTRAVHLAFADDDGATQARREYGVRGQFVDVPFELTSFSMDVVGASFPEPATVTAMDPDLAPIITAERTYEEADL